MRIVRTATAVYGDVNTLQGIGMTFDDRAIGLLRVAIGRYDHYRNAKTAMAAEGLDFGEILTKRGEAIEDLIARARCVAFSGTQREKP